MNTIELSSLAGVRNDVSPERFGRDALGNRTSTVELQSAINVDLDETGKIRRRAGTQRLVAGVAHSLHAAGDDAYVVVDGMLCHLAPDMARTPIVGVSGRVAMATMGGVSYWSDGITSGALVGAANIPWGIDVPPGLTATTTPGALRAGRYLFSMTYVRSSGEESGAVACGELSVADKQGIRFSGLPVSRDPQVVSKRIYLTGNNETLPTARLLLANGATEAVYSEQSPGAGMAIRTQFMGPPPAGQVVGCFGARAFVAQGSTLHFSQPFEPALFDVRAGFVTFESNVRTFSPVADGVFVGTQAKTYWLAGLDPTQWERVQVADFGTVLGTEYELRGDCVGPDGVPSRVAAWFGKKGLCLGLSGGQMKNVTGNRYIPPGAAEGASLMKIRGGTPQLVTTLFN